MRLRFLTAGESHGEALVGILEGVPAGLPLSMADLRPQMLRRKMGFGRGARQAIETDALQILSGVRLGVTLGSPIALLLPNKDWPAWQEIMQVAPPLADAAPPERQVRVPRPGHADRVGGLKYGHADMRNVLERSSARETAMRVAIGSIARTLLSALGIEVGSRIVQIGPIADTHACNLRGNALNAAADASPVRCTNPAAEADMVAAIQAASASGDTLGGIFEVVATGLPLGLGSYAHWDRRLEAEIGRSFLSLNAIKGIEVGMGFAAARTAGSAVHDSPQRQDATTGSHYASNRSGGIDGGMSTGEPLWVRAAMKPLATLMQPLPSVDMHTQQPAKAHTERSDVCAAPSAAVIGESLLALVLADAMLDRFGGDQLAQVQQRLAAWQAEVAQKCS